MRYIYKCPKCKKEHEVEHSMKDEPEIKCPDCGSICERVIFGGTGVIFKGSGFYETDYKDKS
jgi:putative FmdB family regulatory protein